MMIRQLSSRLFRRITSSATNILLAPARQKMDFPGMALKPPPPLNYAAQWSKVAAALSSRHFCTQPEDERLIFEIETEDDFDECVLHSAKPVLAQFYADWCGPCQNLMPRLRAKVLGQQGKVLLAKVNVESGAAGVVEQFEIRAVPTVLCFYEGDEVHRFQGDVDDAYLDQVLEHLTQKEEEGLHKNAADRIEPNEEK